MFLARRRRTLIARGRTRLLVPSAAFRTLGLIIVCAVPPVFLLVCYAIPNHENHLGVLIVFAVLLSAFFVYGVSLAWRSCRFWVSFSQAGIAAARFGTSPARVRWGRVTVVRYRLGSIVLAENQLRSVRIPPLLDGADAFFDEVRNRLPRNLWDQPFAQMERDRRPGGNASGH
jgi:hypothetical protein